MKGYCNTSTFSILDYTQYNDRLVRPAFNTYYRACLYCDNNNLIAAILWLWPVAYVNTLQVITPLKRASMKRFACARLLWGVPTPPPSPLFLCTPHQR